MISSWWLFLIGFVLFLAGRHFEDYTIGISGGLLIFIQGVWIFLNPISGTTVMMNSTIGGVLFVVGGYIWVNSSIELLKSYGF